MVKERAFDQSIVMKLRSVCQLNLHPDEHHLLILVLIDAHQSLSVIILDIKQNEIKIGLYAMRFLLLFLLLLFGTKTNKQTLTEVKRQRRKNLCLFYNLDVAWTTVQSRSADVPCFLYDKKNIYMIVFRFSFLSAS